MTARCAWLALVVAAVAAVAGCEDERRGPRRPGQHWSHPVGKEPASRRTAPQRHPSKRHEGAPGRQKHPARHDARPGAAAAAPVDELDDANPGADAGTDAGEVFSP